MDEQLDAFERIIDSIEFDDGDEDLDLDWWDIDSPYTGRHRPQS